jgi:hypothetical protein
MAAPYTGRYASIRLSSGTTSVEMLGKWDLTIAFDDIDASVFGTVWKQDMCGMQGWTGKFDGFYAVSTAAGSSGQYTLQAAALAQTKLQNLRFYLNSTGDGGSTSYFFMPHYSSNVANSASVAVTNYATDAGAFISNVSVGQSKDGLASVSYDVQGYGALALYFNTSSQVMIY